MRCGYATFSPHPPSDKLAAACGAPVPAATPDTAARLSSVRRLASNASTERWASSLRVLAVADGAGAVAAWKPLSPTAEDPTDVATASARALAAAAATAADMADVEPANELRATELVVAM